MLPLPPAPTLALAGIGLLALFAIWKAALAPRLARAPAQAPQGHS